MIERDHRGPYFKYPHIVGFEETNVVGNVYYANHVLWQGRCREMFLREYASDVGQLIAEGLVLVTLRVECEYLVQLAALDEIHMRMRVGWLRQNRMCLTFEYYRVDDGVDVLFARGEQHMGSMQREGDDYVACPFPDSIVGAIDHYGMIVGDAGAR